MVWWILAVVAIALCSFLADVGVLTVLREPVPFLGGSTISVVLLVCCMGMLLRVARLSRRGQRESMKERMDHLADELHKMGELARKREREGTSPLRTLKALMTQPKKKA